MQSTAHVINIHDLITSFKKIFGEVAFVKNVLYFSTSVILHFSPTSFFIFHKYNLVIFSPKKINNHKIILIPVCSTTPPT